MSVTPTGYWTFFCNPAIWDVQRFLSSNLTDDYYQIMDWQTDWFSPGQMGVLRVGTDKRNKSQLGGKKRLLPGIYALIEVMSEPEHRIVDNDPFWLQPPQSLLSRLIVDIQYVNNLLEQPLLLSILKNDPFIQDPYLIKGFQASTMPLMPEAYKRIISILKNAE